MQFNEAERNQSAEELHLVSTEGLWDLRAPDPQRDPAVVLTWRMWPHGEIARFPLMSGQDLASVLRSLLWLLDGIDEHARGWEVALSLPSAPYPCTSR